MTGTVHLLKAIIFLVTYLEGLKYVRILKELIEISRPGRCIARIRLRSSRVFLASFGGLSRFL